MTWPTAMGTPPQVSKPVGGKVATVRLVKGSFSKSLYCVVNKAGVNDTVVSSVTATATAPRTGASFTERTEMFTVSTEDSKVPSFTLNVIRSGPL